MPSDSSFITGRKNPFRNTFNYNSFPFNSLLYTVTPLRTTPTRSSQKTNKNYPLRVQLQPSTSIHLSGQRVRQAPELNLTHIYRKEYKHFLRCSHYRERNLRNISEISSFGVYSQEELQWAVQNFDTSTQSTRTSSFACSV